MNGPGSDKRCSKLCSLHTIEHSHTFTFSFSINADWQIECRHVTGNVCVLSTKLSNQSVTKYVKPAKYSENQTTYKTLKKVKQMTKLANQNIADIIRYIFQRKNTTRNGGSTALYTTYTQLLLFKLLCIAKTLAIRL